MQKATGLWCQLAEIDRSKFLLFKRRTANKLILSIELFPRVLLELNIGGNTSVELVETPFTKQQYWLQLLATCGQAEKI